MNVLLSIKPKYVKLIVNGIKKYEYRKKLFTREDIRKIIIYASSPEKRIIGEFTISEILHDTPEAIWEMTGNDSGTTKESLVSYAGNSEKIFAIGIGEMIVYAYPVDPYKLFDNFTPPQSFMYLDDTKYKSLTERRLGAD